jgi:Ran GTPase-activating protein (RanGAP) involved in mRNA processing and transport
MIRVELLCDRLVANDAALAELYMTLYNTNDAELKLVLDAAKKNKTVKTVSLAGFYAGTSLSVFAALSLASVVSERPKIQEIDFCWVRFIDFGPIALAIQQNRKLTRLVLENCHGTPNLVECIRWLLTENALESLTLKTTSTFKYGTFKNGKTSFDISGALLGTKSLKELVLQDYNGVIGSETFQAIPHMIRTNQDFETLDLLFSGTIADRIDLVKLVAQEAEGHASLNKLAITYLGESGEDVPHHVGTAKAIGIMLHNAPALRVLSLTGYYMGSAGARHLAVGLSSKTSVVEKLYLPFNNLGPKEAGIFASVLVANQNLKSLVLHHNNIGDAGALGLALTLRQNNTLELLHLLSNGIHSKGASALADALVENNALKDLNLRDNSIGDDGATSIAKMLTRNETIENVCIGGFRRKGLMAFATRLSNMNGLKTLEVVSRCYSSKIGNSFVLALEQNTTLEKFNYHTMLSDSEQVMPQVERLLALNRGGRRLLSATGESVPPLNYWPRILAKSSDNADVLFHFLREMPNVLVAKASSRKRKRGDHDETNY